MEIINFKIFAFALVIIFSLAGFAIATNDNANATTSLIIGKDVWNASQIGVIYVNLTKLNSTQSSNDIIYLNATTYPNITVNYSIVNTSTYPVFNVTIINGSGKIVYPNISINSSFPPIIINLSQNDTAYVNFTIPMPIEWPNLTYANSTPPVQMPAPNSTFEIIIINATTQPIFNATSNSPTGNTSNGGGGFSNATTNTSTGTYLVNLYNIKLSPSEAKCGGEVFVRFYAFNNVNRALNNVRIRAKILDNALDLGNKTFDIPKWMGIYQNISFKVPTSLKSGENKYSLEIWAEDNFGRLSASEVAPFLVSCENVNQFGNVSTKEFINITYNYLLHRDAEKAGLDYWSKWINYRAPKNARLDFMYQVYLSYEYQSVNKLASKNNQEFVNFIFQDLLGRSPIDSELLRHSKPRKSRSMIAKDIIYSDEFKKIFNNYIINFTKSQVDKCSFHYLNVTGVRNAGGKLVVDYNSIGFTNVKVGLSRHSESSTSVMEICSQTSGACGGHSGSPVTQCSVSTSCNYPANAGNYFVRVIDASCEKENIYQDYNFSVAVGVSRYIFERDFGVIKYRSSEWGAQADVVDVLGNLFGGIKDGAFARYTIEGTSYYGDLGFAVAEFDRNISYDEMRKFLAVFNETNYTIEYQYVNETSIGEIDLSEIGSLPGSQIWDLSFIESNNKQAATVLWTSGNKLIFIAIEDVRAFEEDNLKSFGLFIKAYLTKYPSTLLVNLEKSFVFYTDSNGKRSIKVDALIKDGLASFNILYGDGSIYLGNGEDAENKLAMPAFNSNVLIYNITGGDNLFIASQNYLGNINNGESYLLSANFNEFNGSNSVSIKNQVTGKIICENMRVGDICYFGAARLQVAEMHSDPSTWIKFYGSGQGSSFTKIYDITGTKFINLPYVELHYPFQYIAYGNYANNQLIDYGLYGATWKNGLAEVSCMWGLNGCD